MPIQVGSNIGDFHFELIHNNKRIQKDMYRALAHQMNDIFGTARATVEDAIATKIKQVFINTSVYDALINGPLDAHFGIPQGQALGKLDEIINTIATSILVEHKPIRSRSNEFTGGYIVNIVKSNYEDILLLPGAHVVNSFGPEGDELLPWLAWLLLAGNQILVYDYRIQFGNFKKSRSGDAIMVPDEAGGWSVPPAYSGTVRNNWLTRAMKDNAAFIENIIVGAIQHTIPKFF
jgi:hypothetical protein